MRRHGSTSAGCSLERGYGWIGSSARPSHTPLQAFCGVEAFLWCNGAPQPSLLALPSVLWPEPPEDSSISAWETESRRVPRRNLHHTRRPDLPHSTDHGPAKGASTPTLATSRIQFASADFKITVPSRGIVCLYCATAPARWSRFR